MFVVCPNGEVGEGEGKGLHFTAELVSEGEVGEMGWEA